jgi:phenylacetate-CoA ligase
MPGYSGFRYGIYRRLPVSLQNAAVSLIMWRRSLHESSRGFTRLRAFLEGMQRWDPGDIERWRRGRLTQVLLAARRTEFYEPLLPGGEAIAADPEGVLLSLPLIDKSIVSRSPEAFLSEPWPKPGLVRKGTSGTTGSPLRVYWNAESRDWERALIWRQRRAAGCRIGETWRGMLGGHRIVPVEQSEPPFWREGVASRLSYISTYHLAPVHARSYHRYLENRGIRFLEGYPSVLFALAITLRDEGLRLGLDGVFYGAEPLQSHHRTVIEQVFGCYVWDFYGLTERVVSASEFECRNGLHINWENSYYEVVDGAGRGVGAGGYGELVGTSLSNTAFPLLRYRTGDMTSLLEGECTCGRHSPRMAPVDSKVEDLLVLPDGSMLSASNLTFPFKEARHIRQSQIYQPAADRVVIRVVPDGGFTGEDETRLIRSLSGLFPRTVRLELERVGDIPRTRSGKYAFCISDLTRDGQQTGSGRTPR